MGAEAKPKPAAGAAQEGRGEESKGPELNPIEAALRAAREKFSAGKSMTATDEGAGGAGGDDDETGAAGNGEGGDAEDEGAEAEGESAEEAGEGEDEGEGEAEGAAGAAAGGDEDEIVDEGDEDVDPELVVAIPARREGDDDIEITVDDKNVAERLRQLKNAAMRGEQIREAQARIERDQAEIEDMENYIQTDPAGFIINNVPVDVVEVVALSLITEPEIWERVQPRLEQLSDPSELRLMQAELKTQRLEAEKVLQKRAEGRRHSKQQAKIILDGIEKMVPLTDGITESRRETIIGSVQRAVAAAVREKRLTSIDVGDLPLLASAALRQHGIDPMAAAAALQAGGEESEPGKKKPLAKKKQKTAKQLKTASEQRKKAAASSPAGTGAPAAAPKLPAGQTIEERIALAKEKGLGTLLGGA